MPTATSVPSLVADLAAQGYQVEETHISWVFLDADRAYKVKKPVDFGYLDFTSPEKRRRACEKEVQLNRRLAPGVYLGILPVVLTGEGRHRLGGPGESVDWAVEMVRLPAGHRGDRRLEQGTLTPGQLDRLARKLAVFHAGGRIGTGPRRFGTQAAVGRNLEENFRQSRTTLEAVLGKSGAARLEAGLLAFLRDHGPWFRERVERDRVRDGHGDLRLEQMYFDDHGEAVVLDCIEFNDRFRYGDVCSDIAFLSMDLRIRGREDLAETFLAAYARTADDYDLYLLVDFYESYRACVRGKIAGYALHLPGAAPAERDAAEAAARKYFRFALSRLDNPKADAPVIAIGGGMGTGKSTLAEALGRRLGAPVLDSDRTRKRMAGLSPLTRGAEDLWKGLYSGETTGRVYAELRRRAGRILSTGRPVILDASFRTRDQRADLRELAALLGRPFHFIECRADRALVAGRLRRRASAPSVSDGRPEIAGAFLDAWEPLAEDESRSAVVVDTTKKRVEECLDLILSGISWRREKPP